MKFIKKIIYAICLPMAGILAQRPDFIKKIV